MIVGVLGGGQLGRMLALAGYPLGLRFRFYDSAADAPAGQLAPLTVGPFEDHDRVLRWARGDDREASVDVVTYEFENVPVATAHALAGRLPVYPPPRALEEAQDRLREKTLFRRLGIPTPEFESVGSRDDLNRAVARLGLPSVLKTRRMGYDGKGQAVLRTPSDVESAWQGLSAACAPGGHGLILEQFVRFDRELSILAVRAQGAQGSTGVAFYPLVENVHERGILRLSTAPAPELGPGLQQLAEGYARAVLDALGYVGVLAIEWFQVGDRLLANEMAPRVHNSGHWTIEGSACSQFENHLRAVCALPLGSTEMAAGPGSASAMANLIGHHPPLERLLCFWNAHTHLYGKEPRAGRKIGHVTIVEPSGASIRARAQELRRRVAD